MHLIIGVKVGKPLITLAEEQDDKSVQENINGIEEAIKATDSRLLQRNPQVENDERAVLKDYNPKVNSDFNFTSSNEDNEEDEPDEEVVSPSRFEEKLYGQLENQEAKISGFHVEKDPSGRDIYIGPMGQLYDNKNASYEDRNQKIKSGNSAGPQELMSPGKENMSENDSPVEEQVVNDPLAKVSYVLSRQANAHNLSQTYADKDGTVANVNNTSIGIEESSKTNQTDSDFKGNALNNDKTTSGPMRKVGSILLPSILLPPNRVLPLHNRSKSSLKPSESDNKVSNQSLPSDGGFKNLTQEPANTQLPELVESVIERLGNQGSKFVSMELAKHPSVKNVWANAIAQALIKQSDKISQLDPGTKSTNSSSIASLKPDLKGVKSTDSMLKTNDNLESKAKPSKGIANDTRVFSQMKEPTHAIKMNNHTSTPRLHETSKVEYHLNSNLPVPSVLSDPKLSSHSLQDDGRVKPATQVGTTNLHINQLAHSNNVLTVSGQSIQDSEFAKPGGQLGTAKAPMNQEAHKNGINDFNDSTDYNRLLLGSKSVERVGGDHPIKATKHQFSIPKPIVTSTVNGFVSSDENNDGLIGSLDKGQQLGSKPVLTPIASRLVSNKESTTQLEANHDVKIIGEPPLANKPNLAPHANGLASSEYLTPEINAPFLLRNITKLDPSETKYLQLNLLSDPVAKEEFSDYESPFSSQRQLEEEDDKEASYLEHQINDAGQIVQEVLPSLHATLSKADSGEVRYVSGQLQDNPLTKTELAESFVRNNNLINAENIQNAQIMASALKEDSNQAARQYQQRLHSAPTNSAKEEVANMVTNSRSSTSSYGNQDGYKDGIQMKDDLESQMLLSPKTISDISAVDLAPMRNLEGFDGSDDMNKPKASLMYEMQSEGNDQTESMYGGSEASPMTQYDVNPLPATVARAQKKQQIHIKEKNSLKHENVKFRKGNAKSSSTSNVARSPSKSMHIKSSSKHFAMAIKPTKSRNQPGTRESEISPTSVIFGLTANEMKELEKHLAHGGPHTSKGVQESGSLRGIGRETKGIHDAKSAREQEKQTQGSVEHLIDNLVQSEKSNTARKTSSKHRNAHNVLHKRKHNKSSSTTSQRLSFVHKNKKTNHKMKLKRDLESWEAHTDVLNSDLDQIRELSPKAQEDISNVIMKDYEGQQRNFKGIESFPFDEQDPGYAFERSLKDQKALRRKGKAERRSKDSWRYSHGKGISGLKSRRQKIVKGKLTNNRHLTKKSEFSFGSQFDDAKMSKPVVMKGNKILNGDVIPLDDVKNLDAQGLILETLRKESEGDLQYVNSVQKHDMNRMKSMFQSAGDVIGVKRYTNAHHHKSIKKTYSKASRFAEKRDLGDSTAEISDGTFRSPDFEKQLSRALMQESKHDLKYMSAVQEADEHGLKKQEKHPDDPIGLRTISQNVFMDEIQKDKENGTPDSGDSGSLQNNQEKLMLFFQNSGGNDDDDGEQQEVGGKKEWKASNIKGGVLRNLTPEGKVLSSDYKELGNLGSDAQTQLASVLRAANDGDQRDLKELEKMDNDDERDVESLFKPFAGQFKRSTPTGSKEGTIETIADIPDPGSKEKDINVVKNDDDKNGKSY